MSILDQIFAPEISESEISATKKTVLEISPPKNRHECGSPLFWKSTAGFFRCLGCQPPANRNLAIEIFDANRQSGYSPREPWIGGPEGFGGSHGPANGSTGTGAGGDAGGAGGAEMPAPDFSIDSPVLFFDARRWRWVGSVRELMGYEPRKPK